MKVWTGWHLRFELGNPGFELRTRLCRQSNKLKYIWFLFMWKGKVSNNKLLRMEVAKLITINENS